MRRKETVDYSLYLVTDRQLLGDKDLLITVEQAIRGGATVVQLREKDLPTLGFYRLAQGVKGITQKYHVPLIINDRVDIALAVDADGLHIGQSDMPLSVARKLLGKDKIIGVSASTVEQALAAQQEGADYLGIGAIFPTATKGDADSVSLEALQAIKDRVNIPVVAIGGINHTNIKQVIAVGVDGVAVVSAIIGSAEPYEATMRICQLIKKARA